MLNNIPDDFKNDNMCMRVAEIRSLFDYDKESGRILYKTRPLKDPIFFHKGWNTKYAGKEAGFKSHGYIRVSVKGKQPYAHQMAFAIVKGYIPLEIDHIDTDGTNNKWDNLRESTHSENACNCKKRVTNKSGLKGVHWSKGSNCWRMNICYEKKNYYSLHTTKEEAYAAYCQMSKTLHKEFGRC